MSRKTSYSEYRISQTIIAIIYLLLVSILGIATAAAETEIRMSKSLHYAVGGRARTQSPTETVDQYAPLEVDGSRRKSPGSLASGKIGSSVTTSQAGSTDFWFFSADVVLFGDDDNDGYWYGIDLLFDVDTIWSEVDVYAVTYLSYEGGPWNEYAATEDFTLFDSSADDEYNIVTELESGYLTGSYDLLIEIFDAASGDFLVGFGPEDTSELGFLPLEDFTRDAPVSVVPIVISQGHGGGSTGIWFLAVLLLAQLSRRSSSANCQETLSRERDLTHDACSGDRVSGYATGYLSRQCPITAQTPGSPGKPSSLLAWRCA